jgi:tetratricopeptide (TPR) repeat protein
LVGVISEKWQPVLAEDLARNILARQRTVLGTDSPDTAVSESHLARVLAAQGRFDEAIPLRQHALKIERQQPTTSNLDLLDEEANLAFDMMRSGKVDPRETERAYRQLIAECSAKLGAGNPKTLKATDGLATALAQQGRFADEEEALRKALDDGRRELGPEHPRVLGLMSNQAAALGEMGDFDRAEGVLHELIAISQRSEGAMSSRAALAKYNLACVAVHRGNQGAALDLLADALDHGLVPDAALGMEGEEDLAPLRGDARFAALVATAKKRYGSQVADNGAKHP